MNITGNITPEEISYQFHSIFDRISEFPSARDAGDAGDKADWSTP